MNSQVLQQPLAEVADDPACNNGQCDLRIGRGVGADYIVTGNVLKLEGSFFVTIKLYETEMGRLLRGEEVEADSVGDIIKKTREASNILLTEGLLSSISSSSSDNKQVMDYCSL